MGKSLSREQVLRLRLRSQQLTGDRAGDVATAVRRLVAVQAQSTRAARLAVRPRTERVTGDDVDRASNSDRSIVRTWLMRGTLQMVAAEDVCWLVPLYRPAADKVTGRHRELGLDATTFARALPAIQDVLSASSLTRAELVSRLARHGVVIDPSGQAPAHLIGYAARQGLICRGPDISDDEPSYVLLSEWIGDGHWWEPEQAAAELARRYLVAHAPAGVADFAYWSGLSISAARRAVSQVAADMQEFEVGGTPAYAPPGWTDPGADAPCVRLLPHFDAYLLGYRHRDLALDPRYARRIQAGGGMVQPAVVVDGRIVGTWRWQRTGDRGVATVEPFGRLDRAVRAGLETEVVDLARFTGAAAHLRIDPGQAG